MDLGQCRASHFYGFNESVFHLDAADCYGLFMVTEEFIFEEGIFVR